MWDVQKKSNLYFDTNAGVPLSHFVRKGLSAFVSDHPESFSNPSSIHSAGRKAQGVCRRVRDFVADRLNIPNEQIVFTGSGSESNQQIISSWVSETLKISSAPFYWITSEVEHDSVSAMIPWIKKQGGQVLFLPLLSSGAPNLAELPHLLKEHHADPARSLVSVIWVNNETGVITPLPAEELMNFKNKGGTLHADGAQAWGKIEINFKESPWNALTLTGHKIGALSGVGLVLFEKNFPLQPIVLGKQQKGFRGGTENVIGILSLQLALEELDLEKNNLYFLKLKEYFEASLITHFPEVVIIGKNTNRVQNTSAFYFTHFSKNLNLVQKLDALGFSVSAGSACSASIPEPSHVLKAMKVPNQSAFNFIRVSFSKNNTIEDVEALIQALLKIGK